MKRIADWLGALGVNTFNEHFSLITLRGARKRDHPQSFSYHSSWFDEYSRVADYMTRLSVALSQGRLVNKIVVLEPTTTAFIHQARSHIPDGLKKMGDSFYEFHKSLERAQVPHDLLSEYVLETTGSVWGANLQVGRCAYETVIIPPGTENLNAATLRLLEEFASAGGKVVNCASELKLVEGREGNLIETVAKNTKWEKAEPDALVARLKQEESPEFRIEWEAAPGNGIVFHHRRQLKDADLVFLVNTSLTERACGNWSSTKWTGVEEWDVDTGEVKTAVFERAEVGRGGVRGQFDLPAAGSQLLLLSRSDVRPAGKTLLTTHAITLSGELEIRRLHPNVLALNYVDLKLEDEITTGLFHYEATQKVFQKNGFPANPWERAVQFGDEIIRKEFPPESGFEVTYKFQVQERVPHDLAVVVERPDLYEITLNDKQVGPTRDWWLDKQFFRIAAEHAKTGENRLTLRAKPLTVWHEIEPVYVLGSFAVGDAESGFVIRPEGSPKLGSWREQGLPFYAWDMGYQQAVKIAPIDHGNGRYLVELGKWHGSVARVLVNGKPAGTIAWAPWHCDVTQALKPGENEIEVQVIGTLKNTLGPHHGGKIRGSAWPANFHQAPPHGPPPGAEYDFIDYGLFEPWRLVRAEAGSDQP